MKYPSWLRVLPVVFLVACQQLDSSSSLSQSSQISTSISGPNLVEIDLYNLNDFHGAVEHNPSDKELGINRLAGYFKNQLARNPNSVFLSSGDMWQ
jgi:2',3'-cyclic-nucleotide 2'-phosphodiesterase (5'-nucleotidase family)